jgi:hypothetical protein
VDSVAVRCTASNPGDTGEAVEQYSASPNKKEVKNMPYRTCIDCGSREHVRCYMSKPVNEPQDATTAELTYCVKRLTEMVVELDKRVKFDNERIKALELEVFELQKDVHILNEHLKRQETMILRQGMPLE